MDDASFNMVLKKIKSYELVSSTTSKRDLSVVIATYNRCPFSGEKAKLNPLAICLDSILDQSTNRTNDVVIVDDASTDHTSDIVRSYSKQFERMGIVLNYERQKNNQGVCKCRNQGIVSSKEKYALVIDDDCVLHERFVEVYGALMDSLKSERIAILQPPTYTQSRIPTGLIEQAKIGVFDVQEGKYLGNFDRIPSEFVEAIMADSFDLTKPLPVIETSEFAAVGIIDKEVFSKTAGYRDFPKEIGVTNVFGAESEIALDITRLGFKTVMCPDPRVYDVHLRFGSSRREPYFQTLTEREKNSILAGEGMLNTGLRCEIDEWCYNKIASYYFIFSIHNPEAAKSWKEQTRKDFVDSNFSSFYSKGVVSINDPELREAIWKKATSKVEDYFK